MKDEEVLTWMNVTSFRWSLEKGNTMLFWYDTWCGDLPLRIQFPRLLAVGRDIVPINEIQNIKWEKIFQCYLLNREHNMVEELKLILQYFRINQPPEDKLTWIHDVAGKFSVNFLSSLLNLVNLEECGSNFEKLLKLKVPSKIRSFAWMLVSDKLPTKEFLLKWGISIPGDMAGCPWCGMTVESSSHLLICCSFVTVFLAKRCSW
ncbi:hypothetical protein V6N13_059283 [Hibiscus sabdariffa]